MLTSFERSATKTTEKTLPELAALRIETFTQSHTFYDEAMKAFNKMIRDDNRPNSLGDSLYPMRVIKVSQDLLEGILAYCKAAKALASDYDQFCQDPRFVKDYQVRIDYIDIIQEELTMAMSTLKEKLKGIPFYVVGIKNGEQQIQALLEKLTATKQIMTLAIQQVTVTCEKTIGETNQTTVHKDKIPKAP